MTVQGLLKFHSAAEFIIAMDRYRTNLFVSHPDLLVQAHLSSYIYPHSLPFNKMNIRGSGSIVLSMESLLPS